MHIEAEEITPQDVRKAQYIIKMIGMFLGVIVFLWMFNSDAPEGLSDLGWKAAAVAALMCIWWMTEAIPLSATALIPLIAFPLLEVSPVKTVASGFASKGVLLILGGFIIGIALQRWNLHTRIAMLILKVVGIEARRVIAGFMFAGAFLSMWITNTAATTVMLPIAISVIALIRENSDDVKKSDAFAACLLLSLAYSATIGGMMTLVGTPPNLVLKGYLEDNYGYSIDFVDWMKIGVPVGLTLLATTWALLTYVIFPCRVNADEGVKTIVNNKLKQLGKMSKGETRVLIIFAFTIFLWLFKKDVNGLLDGVVKLNDMSIAILASVLMFIVPSGIRGHALLRWENTKELPWGILILMGGAISMAGTLKVTGVADWMGSQFNLDSVEHVIWLVIAATVMILYISELMSNTATITAFLPVIIALSIGYGENPLLIAIPATLAASCAFMLPIGTPPNAIVFGSNMLTIPQMVKAGFLLNIIAVAVIVLISYLILQGIFGVEVGVLPEWINTTAAN